MTIVYADEIGTVAVKVNEYGIDFDGGFAIFEDEDGEEYRVSVADIRRIAYEE